MDIESWRQLRRLSEQCAELPDAEKKTWLKAQGLDDATCDQVLALIDPETLDEDAPNDLAQNITDRMSPADAAKTSETGARIGPWRLLEPIGEGGMGSVYRAERVDGGFNQEAAVKRMRLGIDQRQYLARFEAERQILAGLQHPNIAKLLDGGTTEEGMPYLALEYIRGQTIATYCDQQRLDIAQRLRLFLSLCDAVAYAHRHLIVHRDIKPSNVMVDTEGQIKLLDFGVAKLLKTNSTVAANQTVNTPLTPAYASPEQLRGLPASTQTDVYGLGLLLFKLCTGVLPQRARSSNSADAVSEVLTTDPLAPSTALQRLTHNDAERSEIAQTRATEPASLKRQLRGDLDAILLKALRTEAADRYASVDAFVADIKAYLVQRPVSARRGSKRYRLGRYIARNRLAVGLASLLLCSVVIGSVGTLLKSIEAQRQAVQATEMRDFVADIFRRANPTNSAGAQTSARDLLDQGLARIDQSELSDASSKAQIRAIMADAYLSLGHSTIGHQLASQVLTDVEALGLEGEIKTSAILLKARAESERGERELALTLLNRAEPRIDSRRLSEHLGLLHFERGRVYLSQGEIENATLDMERAVSVYSQLYGRLSDPALNASRVLAWIYDEAERYGDIDTLIRPLIEATLTDQVTSPDPTAESSTNSISNAPINPLYLADLLDAQANALSSMGQSQQAIDYRLQAIQVTADIYGERHRYTGTRWNNLAFSYLRDERLSDAYDAMDRALTILRQSSPEGSHIIGSTASNFARISLLLGRYEQAEALIQEAIAIREVKSTPLDVAFSTQIASTVARAAGDLSLAHERADRAEVLFAALDRKPSSLQQRLLQERAELNLLGGTPENCAVAEQAKALLTNAPSNVNPAQLAYAEFIRQACQAAFYSLSAATSPDLTALNNLLQITLDLQPPESARRVWLKQYYDRVASL